jgi:acyl carrier protein
VSGSTALADLGLGDSKDLLDLILEIEARCAVEFDPERINFVGAVTLQALASAFTKANSPLPKPMPQATSE